MRSIAQSGQGMKQQQQFQIHLPGLLKVLAESLYSTPKVALRELIQNAHDSCIRRAAEQPDASASPRIDFSIDPVQRILTIQDNGSGLTADEVNNYLSTIGRSYTSELRDNLAVLTPERSTALIGQFGLGFLSAFLIASEVRFYTYSVQPGHRALQWRSNGDIHYETSTAPDMPIGTRVELTLKPNAYFLLNDNILRDTVRDYADFLPTPIYVNGSRYPINQTKPPWEARDPETATRDYIARAFNIGNPLWILPLTDQIIDLGHDSLTIPLRGFLFIPPSTITSVREYGDTHIYIKGMFIRDNDRALLPSWAKFVRGVIDSPQLQPTASREDIQKDDEFNAIKQAIEKQLLDGLRRLAQESGAVWQQVVHGHSDVIIGWATTQPTFFREVADLVMLRTTRGLLNLPQYLSLTHSTIYYTTQQIETLQQQVIAEAVGLPVIDASWFAVEPFLTQYVMERQNISLVKLDSHLSRLFEPAPEDDFGGLVDFYASQRIAVKVAVFKPEIIPAIMIYPKDADFIRETRSAIDSNELPDPIRDLMSDYLGKMDTETLSGTLYLNAGCPLIHELAAMPAESNRNAILTIIYQTARLFSGKMLDTQGITTLFEATNEAMMKLIQRPS